jgi:hypothetical protein
MEGVVMKRIIQLFFWGLLLMTLACGIVYYLEQQTFVKKKLEHAINSVLIEQCGCMGTVTLESFSILFPKIVLKDVDLSEKNSTWRLQCPEITAQWSWFDLISLKKARPIIRIPSLTAYSRFENSKLAIVDFIHFLLSPSSLPIVIDPKSVVINRGIIMVNESKDIFHGYVFIAGALQQKAYTNILTCSLYDGNFFYNNHHCSIPSCTVYGSWIGAQTTNFCGMINGTCKIPLHKTQKLPLAFHAIINQNTITTINAHSQHRELELAIRFDNEKENTKAQLEGSVDLSQLYQQIPFLLSVPFTAIGRYKGTLTLNKDSLSHTGTISFDNISYEKTKVFDSLTISHELNNSTYIGTIAALQNNTCVANGSFSYDIERNTGTASLSNPQAIQLDPTDTWQIPAKTLSVNATYNNKEMSPNNLTGTVVAQIVNTKTKSSLSHVLNVAINNNQFSITGALGGTTYLAQGICSPWAVDLFTIHHDNKPLVKAKIFKQAIEATIDYQLINWFVPDVYKTLFAGTGTLMFNGFIHNGILDGSLYLQQGSIYLARTANLITGLDAHISIDSKQKEISIPSATIQLHHGTITIHDGAISLPYSNQKSLYFTLPLSFSQCLISWNYLDALFSGELIFLQTPTKPISLSGSIVINKGLISSPLHFTQFYQTAFESFRSNPTQEHQAVALDIQISNEQPISLKTESLATYADINISIQQTSKNPLFIGSITGHGGHILFPYKAIAVQEAAIHFSPEHQHAPLLEFVARDTIKNYVISMYASGTTAAPIVSFDSSPALTEEQIGALLLTGSEDTTLNILMPAFIIHNLKTTVSNYGAQKPWGPIVKRIMKPFDHIRLIPSFTDQTGRNGMQAALEIDTGSRWKARVEKSLSSSEDTSFEVDYSITDNINARVARNKQGEMGTEVEMRWRF